MTQEPRRVGCDARDLILAELRRARRQTLFATELAATARTAGIDSARLERGLTELERTARVVVLHHPPPDAHLDGADLRTVCVVNGPSTVALDRARRLAEAYWEDFLRAFLAAHRCC